MRRPEYPFYGMNNEEIGIALALWNQRTTPTPLPGTVVVPLPGGTFPPARGK